MYGIDYYVNQNVFSEEQIGEIEKGLKKSLDVSKYAKSKMPLFLMSYYRRCLLGFGNNYSVSLSEAKEKYNKYLRSKSYKPSDFLTDFDLELLGFKDNRTFTIANLLEEVLTINDYSFEIVMNNYSYLVEIVNSNKGYELECYFSVKNKDIKNRVVERIEVTHSNGRSVVIDDSSKNSLGIIKSIRFITNEEVLEFLPRGYTNKVSFIRISKGGKEIYSDLGVDKIKTSESFTKIGETSIPRELDPIQEEDLEYYKSLGTFDRSQLEQVRLGFIDGVKVTIYAKPEFNSDQMEQARLGLCKGLEINTFFNLMFGAKQMSIIRRGVEESLQVKIYAKPEFDHYQMEEIYLGMKNGVDVSSYADSNLSDFQMRDRRMMLMKK